MSDTYTGRVVPGGPVDVRELPHLTIRKLAVSQMSNNVYLLTCRTSRRQLLIDAADEAPRILELVRDGDGEAEPDTVAAGTGAEPLERCEHPLLQLVRYGGDGLDAVLTTHRHGDHVRALEEVVAATGARTLAGAQDADGLTVPVDEPLGQGDQVRFGEITLDRT